MLDMEPNDNPLFGAANGTAANGSAPKLARTQSFEQEARSPQKSPKDAYTAARVAMQEETHDWRVNRDYAKHQPMYLKADSPKKKKPPTGPVTPNGPPPELLRQSEGVTTFEDERQENKSPRGKSQENLSSQVAWMAGGIPMVVLIWWMIVGGSW